MRNFARYLLVAAVAVAGAIAFQSDAQAQVPIAVTTVQPVVPAVVGYTAERRGLFGRRVVYRPVVAPVGAAVPVASTVTVARPVVTVARPVVTVARPVVPAPIIAPPPVAAYYPPVAVPVAVPAPVTTYRVPVVYPYWGF